MKDFKVDRDHATKKVIIYESEVDVEMIPIVRWLNSLKGIMTRWSCQGENPKEGVGGLTYYPPYITIWVEVSPITSVLGYDNSNEKWNDLDTVHDLLSKYDSAKIDAVHTKGLVQVYQISFDSNIALEMIRSDCIKMLAAGESDE